MAGNQTGSPTHTPWLMPRSSSGGTSMALGRGPEEASFRVSPGRGLTLSLSTSSEAGCLGGELLKASLRSILGCQRKGALLWRISENAGCWNGSLSNGMEAQDPAAAPSEANVSTMSQEKKLDPWLVQNGSLPWGQCNTPGFMNCLRRWSRGRAPEYILHFQPLGAGLYHTQI